MFPVPVSKTKIIPPRRRSELLARRRLLNSLFDALESKLVLVSAPAGYGKTSLLIDVVQESEFTCCWLSLDELDRDPQRFLAYLVASIAERFPGVGGQTAAVMSRVDSFEDEMERLAVTLVNETYESIHEHFVLILDDFHLLDGMQLIHDFLNRFIQLVDDNCHVIISSRMLTTLEDLPLMVAREQVRGLSFSDLAFQVDEIKALFMQNNKAAISDEDAQRLIDETEGWITGLQFSGTSFLAKGAKTGVGLFDYLGQQVVDRQKPEVRELLLRTSLMDEFDVGLCEAVLAPFHKEKQNWDLLIRVIVTNNLFALPVGSEGGAIRYHHLFRDYLRQRMEKERRDEVRPILVRLSRAYESLGEWEKAYAVISQLKDSEALAELIDLASFNNLQVMRRLVETWMRDLPPSMLKNDSRLLSIGGALKLTHGDTNGGLAELTQAIERFRADGDIPHLGLSLVRRSFGYYYLGNLQSTLDDLEEAVRLLEDHDDLQALYAEALYSKGANLQRIGNTRDALKCHEHALDILIRLGIQKDIPAILTSIGTIQQKLGNPVEAERIFRQALDIYKRDLNLAEQANLLNNMGYMFHLDGEYEKAASTYENALLCAQRSHHLRTETLISISIGDLFYELKDVEIAERNYTRAEQLLEERDDIFLHVSVLLGRINLALDQRDISAAETAITKLKKRIVHSQSQYELGHADLVEGRYHVIKGNFQVGINSLEAAEAHFVQGGLSLELLSTAVWLSAAYAASGCRDLAVDKLKSILDGKPRHATLIAVNQCHAWLIDLQKDPEIGRVVRDLFQKADKLAAQLPHVRRELRRQAHVVEVPVSQMVIKGFGRSAVEIRGKELSLSEWQTQSVRELFFFFVSQPRPLTKEKVAEQFWQELDEPAKVRLRFKNEMYRLRRAVGNEVILFENQVYFFNRSLDYEYDVEAFESHMMRARSARQPEEQIGHYKKAVDLFKGPYLDDIYFDWVIADRERLDQQYLAALHALADLHHKRGSLEEGIALCQRAVEYKPTYEAAYQLEMQIHHRMGNRPAVIRTYEACKTALRKHLSLPPSPETEALYRKLLL